VTRDVRSPSETARSESGAELQVSRRHSRRVIRLESKAMPAVLRSFVQVNAEMILRTGRAAFFQDCSNPTFTIFPTIDVLWWVLTAS
jgi:hypothetical protein